MTFRVINADCREAMAAMEPESFDAIVCDPPYELGFMGKAWDKRGVAFDVETWRGALRVLKPGAHLVAFGGTRTFHRMTCAIEDAGSEIRDCLTWLYGSGFPKSLDVSKAIDKAAGAERTAVVGSKLGRPGMARDGSNQRSGFDAAFGCGNGTPMEHRIFAPATDAACQWQGWGTALKPAWEPIILARKPLSEKNVAANVRRWGAGALNIDGCRIETADVLTGTGNPPFRFSGDNHRPFHDTAAPTGVNENPLGRWPANLILGCDCEGEHDAECAVAMLDAQSGELQSGVRTGHRNMPKTKHAFGSFAIADEDPANYGDSGGASRFFYCAKTATSERNIGGANNHPTVKPVELMRWLCRLITPPGGLVLDPFAGSGSTGIAALREGFRFVGIEQDAHNCTIARARITGDAPLLNAEATA